jgi:hypothetical protein
MIHFDFSSDLSSGRRPMSKSDEKSKCIIIVIEIWRCENFSFAVHRYSLSEHDSEAFCEASRQTQHAAEHKRTCKPHTPDGELLEYGFLTAMVAIMAVVVSSQDHAVHLPDLAVWYEVLFSFMAGCAINLLLALAMWSTLVSHMSTTLFVSGMVLCVPYALPFEFGISASAHKH